MLHGDASVIASRHTQCHDICILPSWCQRRQQSLKWKKLVDANVGSKGEAARGKVARCDSQKISCTTWQLISSCYTNWDWCTPILLYKGSLSRGKGERTSACSDAMCQFSCMQNLHCKLTAPDWKLAPKSARSREQAQGITQRWTEGRSRGMCLNTVRVSNLGPPGGPADYDSHNLGYCQRASLPILLVSIGKY